MEERWASVVTEMLMGVLYSSPGQAYQNDYNQDHLFFEKMAPATFPSEGVPYPLTAACQQLCTIALISRGYTAAHFGQGVNAGGSSGLPLFQLGGGRWVNNGAWLNPDEALKQSAPDGVAAGSLYEWTLRPGPTRRALTSPSSSAHRPGAGQGSWNGIQFFDTGGVAIPNRASGVTVRTDGKGNYDNPWAVQPFSGHPPLRESAFCRFLLPKLRICRLPSTICAWRGRSAMPAF